MNNKNHNSKSIHAGICGKIPPQSIDVEVVVLGAIILESFVLPEIYLLLFPELFYRDSHRIIFESIKHLYINSQPVDLVTVTNDLRKKNELENVGGAVYLTELTMHVAQSNNIETHIRILTEKFIAREQIRLSQEIGQLGYDESSDVFETQTILENSITKINQYIIGKDYEGDISTDIEKTYQFIVQPRDHRLTGISTGSKELDDITGGWNKGDMIIICGRPSMGKTTRAMQFIIESAKEGKKVAFFSAEMNKQKINTKFLSHVSKVSGNILKDQSWNESELDKIIEAKNIIKTLPIYINEKTGIKPNYIRTVCNERKRKYGLDLVVIDYLQLLLVDEYVKGQSEEQRVASISLGIKTLAKNLDVPIIILSQLSRECESRPNKRPLASDLRYSGSLEQDADLILSLYRPSIYHKKQSDKDYKDEYNLDEYCYSKISELGILKNRMGEANICITEYFDGANSSYYNQLLTLNENQIRPEQKVIF